MSGICGVFHRHGAPASLDTVNRMLAAQRHRGPDGQGVWCAGPVAFGHGMLRVTPESLHERLPAADSTGDYVITADARIDNREELMRALDLSPASEITDSELILAAYEEWGEVCPEKLLGDFAFAIWDVRRQQLFLSSDPMGVKSIYYYVAPDAVYFGSELKALVAVPEVPRELNEVRVAEYLVSLFEDRTGTFYKNILRLPGAHSMVIERSRMKIWQYWRLDPKRELRLGSDGEYVEAFRDLFAEAVRCRVRSAFPVGSALSGGLDSSSIACMARNFGRGAERQIHTYSLIFPGLPAEDLRVIDERPQIQAVLDSGGFIPHFVEADRLSPMWQIERMHYHLDQANFAPNLYLHWAMYDHARSDGVRVFLDGFDGDATVSHGFERLTELVQRLQWRTLCREIAMLSQNHLKGVRRRRIFKKYCVLPFAPRWACLAWQILRGRKREALGNNVFISDDLKNRAGIEQRAAELLREDARWAPLRTARETHYGSLTQQLYSYTLEMTDKATAAFQIEARYPFFDRRLMEFCLSIPASQKMASGWNRWTMRRALAGVLPHEIQWRPKKGNLSPNFHRRLLDFERERLEDVILRGRSELNPFVDIARMKAAYAEYERTHVRSQGESMQLFAVVNLALWLRSSGLCPQTQLHAAA